MIQRMIGSVTDVSQSSVDCPHTCCIDSREREETQEMGSIVILACSKHK